jgi:3-oxoacyl-[acyl-carrier-protein] synthase-3
MMATHAAQEALEVADVSPTEIELVIVATATPEYPFPATACLVQNAIGAEHAGAFDLEAGCSGFMYAVSVAAAMIRSDTYKTVLVIGSETLSRVIDWDDRGTCVLFGDGAGAFVMRGSPEPGGVLSTVLGSDGSGGELLIIPGGGSKHPAGPDTVTSNMHTIKMNGREVYRFATRVMASASKQAAQKAGWEFENINLFIPHQANSRIISYAAKAMNLSDDKVFVNVEKYGNTSAASIPIATCEALDAGRIKPGDNLLMVGFGAGLTWGACAVQWTATPHKPTSTAKAVSRVRFGFGGLRSLLLRFLRFFDAIVSQLIEWIERKPPQI